MTKKMKRLSAVESAVFSHAFQLCDLTQAVNNVRIHTTEQAADDLSAMLDAVTGVKGQVEQLAQDFRQFKCQVETKHRMLRYESCRLSGEDRLLITKLFTFVCKDCGYIVEKATDELTMKDREALIALGLLEV